ncbi:SMP-30/gluconolactonase/LRE family protein [Aquipuribacter sp. SD81]|uniref:SMP-30/gluconolactonase/LRE family protein n=1 Tax=Aquipuribacter sp. SD81 TaxID=3127703 RepID=UPI00301593D0
MTTTTFATGIGMGESARWHRGRLWLCDWVAGEVLAFSPAGDREVVTRVEGVPFSVDWLPDGRLVVCTSDGVRVGPGLEPYGALGRPWNEIAVGPEGHVFVDMPGSMPWEDPAPGVVAVVRPDGSSDVVAGGLAFPNGLAVVDGGATLLVAESHAARLTAFTVGADGSLTDRRVWADLGDGAAPDGICVGTDGTVWYADVPNAHCRRVAEGGEVLATVPLGSGAFSCALGGDDGRTLFAVVGDWDGHGVTNGRVLATPV